MITTGCKETQNNCRDSRQLQRDAKPFLKSCKETQNNYKETKNYKQMQNDYKKGAKKTQTKQLQRDLPHRDTKQLQKETKQL